MSIRVNGERGVPSLLHSLLPSPTIVAPVHVYFGA